MNYYNEFDPKTAAWLRELIKAGHIAEGVVDERSIVDVSPSDLREFRQCHFFAGIGGWSLALRLAGIPDDEPVWTGSCPCQPFSNAGKRKGTADERHLWPEFARLIEACQPSVVFGEQVASKDGRKWLAGVFADLERMGYRPAGADLCAAGVKSPHIRQRLWWVANTDGRQSWHEELQPCGQHRQQQENGFTNWLEHPESHGREQRGSEPSGRSIACGCGTCGVVDPMRERRRSGEPWGQDAKNAWEPSEIIHCTDGKSRRVEPGTFPLAHGVSGRVGLLRGYGNAIVPQVAAEFIQAFYEVRSNV